MQELSEKEPLGLTANLFLQNCMLPEYYMRLLAAQEYKHPMIISSNPAC